MILEGMLVPQTRIDGCQLEIDGDRGVIYVHGPDGTTKLRISGLPAVPSDVRMIDMNLERGTVSYTNKYARLEMP